jgi:homogentisate 1,2-dioxygenase
MGKLEVKPGELVVLQLGIRFAIELPDGPSRGYVVEVFSGHFQLPDLGPIGTFWTFFCIPKFLQG